jgi:hypothetical protein
MYKFQSIAKTTNANLLGSITMYMWIESKKARTDAFVSTPAAHAANVWFLYGRFFLCPSIAQRNSFRVSTCTHPSDQQHPPWQPLLFAVRSARSTHQLFPSCSIAAAPAWPLHANGERVNPTTSPSDSSEQRPYLRVPLARAHSAAAAQPQRPHRRHINRVNPNYKLP